MAGACVYRGDVIQMLDIKNQHTLWIAVGRTTAWTDEQNPPDEDLTTTDIDEIQGFKKADTVSLCVPDANGTIEFNGQKYRLVDDADAYTEVARYLYISAALRYDQFPVVTFRQTAVYVDTVPAAGYEDNDILVPGGGQVSDNGKLYYYYNHPPRYRDASGVDIIEVVIELRGQNT